MALGHPLDRVFDTKLEYLVLRPAFGQRDRFCDPVVELVLEFAEIGGPRLLGFHNGGPRVAQNAVEFSQHLEAVGDQGSHFRAMGRRRRGPYAHAADGRIEIDGRLHGPDLLAVAREDELLLGLGQLLPLGPLLLQRGVAAVVQFLASLGDHPKGGLVMLLEIFLASRVLAGGNRIEQLQCHLDGLDGCLHRPVAVADDSLAPGSADLFQQKVRHRLVDRHREFETREPHALGLVVHALLKLVRPDHRVPGHVVRLLWPSRVPSAAVDAGPGRRG